MAHQLMMLFIGLISLPSSALFAKFASTFFGFIDTPCLVTYILSGLKNANVMDDLQNYSRRRARRRAHPASYWDEAQLYEGVAETSQQTEAAESKLKDDLISFASFMGKALSMLVEVQLHQKVYHGDSEDVAGEGGSFTVTAAPVPFTSSSSISAPSVVVKFPNAVGVTDAWNNRLEAILCELRVLTARPIRRHPNITQLKELAWKAALHPQKLIYPGLLLERAPLGNLFDFQQPDVFSLNGRAKISICRDIAVGLAFLHECGIAHSDIKPENVLLFHASERDPTGYPVAKIADFSHAVFECDAKDGLVTWRGYTTKWAAPEVLEQNTQSAELIFQADVYSYGLLFWHILLDSIDIFSTIPPDAKFFEDRILSAAQSSLQKEPKDLNVLRVQDVLELCLKREVELRTSSISAITNILEDEIRRYDNLTSTNQLEMQDHLAAMSLEESIGKANKEEAKNEFFPPSKITWAVDEEEEVFNINEACVALQIMNTQVKRQIYQGMIYSLQRPLSTSRAAETILQLSVCHFYGFGTEKDHEVALGYLTMAANHGSIKAMAISKRVSMACGKSVMDPSIEATTELMEEERPLIEYWLLNGAETLSLVALDDCASYGEEMRLKGLIVFSKAQRNMKGLVAATEPELIAEVRETLQSQQLRHPPEYFVIKAMAPFDENGNNHLHLVASAGYVEYIQFFIDIGCDIEAKNNAHETPLLLAMESLRADAAILLLSHGANPTSQTLRGRSPLHYIGSFRGDDLERLAVALILVVSGNPELNIDVDCQEFQSVPWHFYMSVASGTPLSWAVSRNNVRAAEILLTLGADPLVKNQRGSSPTFHSVFYNQVDIFSVFVQEGRPWARRVCEDLVASFGDYATALTTGNDFQCIIMLGESFQGARSKMIGLFKELNNLNNENKAFLLWSCVNAGLLHDTAQLLQFEGYGKYLDLKPQAHPTTCLYQAVQHGDRELFDLLMSYGPDLGIRHEPLGAAYLSVVASIVTDSDVQHHFLAELLAHGINVDMQNEEGVSALCFALCRGDVRSAKYLRENGADLLQEDKRGVLLLGNVISSIQASPIEVLEFYFTEFKGRGKGIREFVVDKQKNLTALHYVASRPQEESSISRVLLMYLLGVFRDQRFLDYQDNDGATALHHAAALGNVMALKLLLEAGADRTLCDAKGETALAICRQRQKSVSRSELCQSFLGGRAGKSALSKYDAATRESARILEDYNTVTSSESSRNDISYIANLLLGDGEEAESHGLDEWPRLGELRSLYPLLFGSKGGSK